MRPSKTTLFLVKEKCETEKKNSTWQQQHLVWHQAQDVQIYVDADLCWWREEFDVGYQPALIILYFYHKIGFILTGNCTWQLNEKHRTKSYWFKVLRLLQLEGWQPKPSSGVAMAPVFKPSINKLPRNIHTHTHTCTHAHGHPYPSLQAVYTQTNSIHEYLTHTCPRHPPAPCPSTVSRTHYRGTAEFLLHGTLWVQCDTLSYCQWGTTRRFV